MLIPAFIYGHALDVKKACRKAARKIVKEKDLFVCEKKMLDTNDINACYCFEYPDSTINHYEVIYIGYLFTEIGKNLVKTLDIYRHYIEPALEKPWSFFMICENLIWIRNLKLELPFLESLIKFWDILNKELTTYGVKNHGRKDVWQQMRSIKFVMNRVGVPWEELNKPKLDGHIKDLIEKYNLLDKTH